jgi:hypothetical protein
MSASDWTSLANAYLDGTLDAEGHATLSAAMASDPEVAAAFARLVVLHDALDREMRDAVLGRRSAAAVRRVALGRRVLAMAATLALALTAGWFAIVAIRPASAGEILARLAAAAQAGDRTYRLRENPEPGDGLMRSGPRSGPRSGKRPAVPVDGAFLFVRSPDRYVLERRGEGGSIVVSGSDGSEAWIVPESGPVRVSRDPHRFAGAVPGSRTGVPFADPRDGLDELATTYDLRLEPADPATPGSLDRIVATRRPEARGGPKLVEIAFDAATNRLHAMRLEHLPQARGGPHSVLFELLDESPLPPDFFSHRAHHEVDRPVIVED